MPKIELTDKMDTRNIYVYADWKGIDESLLLGILSVTNTRGKEVFSFEYNADWLRSGIAQNLDPDLGLYSGAHNLYEMKK